MELYAGTSGYAYKEWKGSFYPESLPAKEMLSYYAGRFRAVEINNTFYRMPAEHVLVNWGRSVPDGFAFALKASRRITHFKRLRDVEDELAYVLKVSSVLRDKLGPTLFQLPPNFAKDVPRLRDFLGLLPPRWRSAFEFRHPSWFDDEVYQALREHGAAVAAAETDEDESVSLPVTADWGYLRLRKAEYGDEALRAWGARLRETGWSQAYVFFKHEDEGSGPRLAARFEELFA